MLVTAHAARSGVATTWLYVYVSYSHVNATSLCRVPGVTSLMPCPARHVEDVVFHCPFQHVRFSMSVSACLLQHVRFSLSVSPSAQSSNNSNWHNDVVCHSRVVLYDRPKVALTHRKSNHCSRVTISLCHWLWITRLCDRVLFVMCQVELVQWLCPMGKVRIG
jgi:hypothetical protein